VLVATSSTLTPPILLKGSRNSHANTAPIYELEVPGLGSRIIASSFELVETTSGLLSFALYALIKNPKVLERGNEEVDRVLGADVNALPTQAQTHQLPYVSQILEETLRLWPTASAFTRRPYKDTVLGGTYKDEANSAVVVLTGMLHRDPKIWGDNPEAFVGAG
jgi:hypothetical protein